MKVVILAGGQGTRISEESYLKPKPMVEIGGKPILWHIMKGFEAQGFNDFIICLGYKGHMIKDYFINYYLYNSDVTIDLASNKLDVHRTNAESFKVTLVDTGLHTLTAGRLQQVRRYLGDEDFLLTYGDGLADVDLHKLIDQHKNQKKLATVTAVQPEGRFGLVGIDQKDTVTQFHEKPLGDGGWINGGFFVMSPGVFSYLPGNADVQMLEQDTLENLAHDHQLAAYKHHGFWKCMDALRDKEDLEKLWSSGHPAWKTWA
jgi:glucose-1-phosphate cytidylyltransferase